MKRKVFIALMVALTALGLGVAGASAVSAQPAKATCSVGSWSQHEDYGPPGVGWVFWTNNSTPTTCESIRVRIESQQGHYYEGKWVHYSGDGTSKAATSKCSCDGTPLAKAFVQREPTGNGAKCQQREYYPAVKKWYGCPKPVHTTALERSRKCVSTIGPSAWGATWFEGQWSVNECGMYLRGFAHCQEGHSTDIRLGGWVVPNLKWSKATCLPGWVRKGGGVDTTHCTSGCAVTRHWVTGSNARKEHHLLLNA